MASDNTPLPQESKKPAWLQEVEDDAVYITNKRFKDAEEEKKRNDEIAKREADKADKASK